MKKTIAEHMRDILIERDIENVWYGSLDEIHECAERVGMYKESYKGDTHPLSINNKILSGLERSDLFEKILY